MSKSNERDGFFGKYTEHFDDDGNKIGESREREGFFGKYTEHTDADRNKIGESRERDGFFGSYTEHTNTSGTTTGESREREGFFGSYSEHTDRSGNKTGESRERDGFFGSYTEHTGTGSRGDEGGEPEGSSSSGGSLCFISSACVISKGLSDDCYELRTLRGFRDKYVLSLPEGNDLVEEYYAVAPVIVRQINDRKDATALYSAIYSRIEEAIRLIETGKDKDALNCYIALVNELRTQFVG